MDYAKLTVADLKDLLKQRGLSATGLYRKQQIIDVLEQDDAQSGEPAEEDDAEEEEVEVKAKTGSRSSTKRKASSPVPAGPTSKQPKKAKPEPP
ncbi:hypothetical protein KCV02_g15631, partial [Aureobasidium melanogenum]